MLRREKDIEFQIPKDDLRISPDFAHAVKSDEPARFAESTSNASVRRSEDAEDFQILIDDLRISSSAVTAENEKVPAKFAAPAKDDAQDDSAVTARSFSANTADDSLECTLLLQMEDKSASVAVKKVKDFFELNGGPLLKEPNMMGDGLWKVVFEDKLDVTGLLTWLKCPGDPTRKIEIDGKKGSLSYVESPRV